MHGMVEMLCCPQSTKFLLFIETPVSLQTTLLWTLWLGIVLMNMCLSGWILCWMLSTVYIGDSKNPFCYYVKQQEGRLIKNLKSVVCNWYAKSCMPKPEHKCDSCLYCNSCNNLLSLVCASLCLGKIFKLTVLHTCWLVDLTLSLYFLIVAL